MYHDLCIPYTTSQSDLLRTLSFLVELSYSVAAISLPLPSGPTNKPTPKLPDLPSPPPGLRRLHTRVTLPLLTNSDLPNTRLQALQQIYDLVALRPTSEKTLLLATSAPEVDLISLDLSARWPFHFRPKMFSAAAKRGVFFEICYSPVLDSSSSSASSSLAAGRSSSVSGDLVLASDAATARRNLIANATSLIRALRGGKNIIFSSDAKSILGLRAPMDVVNFGVLLGLSAEKGLEAVRDGPSLVLRAARARRDGWRGVLLAVQVKQKPSTGIEQETGRGVKRKIGEGVDEAAGEGEGNALKKATSNAQERLKASETLQVSTGQLSKRQMKKMAKLQKQGQQEKDLKVND